MPSWLLPPQQQPPLLQHSTIYSAFEHQQPSATTISTVHEDPIKHTTPVTNKRRSKQMNKMEMPRHGPSAREMETAKTVEAIAGRGAMLAAIVLLTTEVATDMSLPEQLSKLFN